MRAWDDRHAPSEGGRGAAAHTGGDERAPVLAVVAQERRAVEDGDVKAYLQVFAEDAALLRPNAEIQRGAALRAAASDFLEHFKIVWLHFETRDVAVVEDLAYHEYAYTWSVTPRAGGEASVESGTAYHVLRSRADGSWRITREVWNAARPGVCEERCLRAR
ncbi:MAG TPA: DUF4440 domain-containing protein [Vicinamibacteria bacterium]|nr:DUF4440 domain-containing protein [Vicinamibacteria bacterium]